MYIFSFYYITKDKYFKYSLNQITIREKVYIYPMYVAKENESLFVINLKRLLCIYASMCDEPCAFIREGESD